MIGIECTEMDIPERSQRRAAPDLEVADWRVQPSLNRLSRGDQVIQLEPKLMDVLVYLAQNAGRVVSKIDITDAVWPDVFITESVITRSIAGLRRSFGDDVKNPEIHRNHLKTRLSSDRQGRVPAERTRTAVSSRGQGRRDENSVRCRTVGPRGGFLRPGGGDRGGAPRQPQLAVAPRHPENRQDLSAQAAGAHRRLIARPRVRPRVLGPPGGRSAGGVPSRFCRSPPGRGGSA